MEEGVLDRGLRNTVDWRLIVLYLVIMLFGWINIYAAVQSAEPSSILDLGCNSGKQAVWILGAIIIAALTLFVINPYFWDTVCKPAYGVILLLLVMVIFMSHDVKGSHSWFEFGSVKFQPAEVSKITTSLMLAWLMSRPNFRTNNWRHLLLAVAVVLVPMLAIVAESETGSALVYVGFIFVLYREGLSGWWLVMLGMAILLFVVTVRVGWWLALLLLIPRCVFYIVFYTGKSTSLRHRRRIIRNVIFGFLAGVTLIVAADVIFHSVLKDYQRERIEVLLGMKEDLRGVGYNVHQSLIAIGSGGLVGKGYLKGTQTTFGFVPEPSTDFIFCTVGD